MSTPTNIIYIYIYIYTVYIVVRPSDDFKEPLALHGHNSWSVCTLALTLLFILFFQFSNRKDCRLHVSPKAQFKACRLRLSTMASFRALF
jgi:hypothetical protein